MSTISFQQSNSNDQNNPHGSRLSPFKRIPRIGYVNLNRNENENENENLKRNVLLPHPPSSRRNVDEMKFNPRSKQYLNRSQSKSKSISIENKQIQLAIRLINGKRIVHQFNNQQTIGDLIQFIQTNEKFFFNDQFFLATAEIPKREFHQLNQTIEQSNIQDKTLLIVDRF